MFSYVKGIKPPDDKWKRMKAVYDSCDLAGIDVPEEVSEYFGWEEPDNKGVVVDLDKHDCCKKYKADMQDGFEIDLTKLPKDITIIRFVNSY